MNVNITTLEFDLLGSVTIPAKPDSDIRALQRRVNRTPTLDLGVAINDRGFTHGDRTFTLRWQPRRDVNERVRYIIETHSRVRVTTDEGQFEAALGPYTEGRGESSLQLLIINKVSS
jgi:hypothetical protein